MVSERLRRIFAIIPLTVAAMVFVAATGPAHAEGDYPYEGVIEIDSAHDFDTLWTSLETAIKDAEMLLLYKARASRGAAGRGEVHQADGRPVHGVRGRGLRV